jgi:hypothetical protein
MSNEHRGLVPRSIARFGQHAPGRTTMSWSVAWRCPLRLIQIACIAVLMVGFGLATTLADPAGRSGVWEAIETISGASIHFRLYVALLTDGKAPDGTFRVRQISARLLAAGVFLNCDLDGETSELVSVQLSGPCRGNRNRLRLVGTFDVKDESISVLLIGDDVAMPIQFHRIPIDSGSTLAGDWYGSSDLAPRESTLRFRVGFDGTLILTLDSWSSEHGCWGWEMAVGSTSEDNVSFHMTATIEQSAFYGTLSPDKRQIDGNYSGGQFASDQYARLEK